MAGIPPLAGFFGKYYILSSALDAGLYFHVIVALALSLISTYYYIRVIKTFWFEENIAVTESVLLLTDSQRKLLSLAEAILWVTALFLPAILPLLDDSVHTLTICGDVSVCVNTTI
jgi:NADH-quinone oxidoreductase subunit N